MEYDADLRLGKITITTSGAYNDGKTDGQLLQLPCRSRGCHNRAACHVRIRHIRRCQWPDFSPKHRVGPTSGRQLLRHPMAHACRVSPSSRARPRSVFDTDIGDYKTYFQGSALYQTSATQDLNEENNRLLTCPGLAPGAASFNCSTPGFVSFDFGAGIKKDKWTLDVFLQNAFDKRGELTRNTFLLDRPCARAHRAPSRSGRSSSAREWATACERCLEMNAEKPPAACATGGFLWEFSETKQKNLSRQRGRGFLYARKRCYQASESGRLRRRFARGRRGSRLPMAGITGGRVGFAKAGWRVVGHHPGDRHVARGHVDAESAGNRRSSRW